MAKISIGSGNGNIVIGGPVTNSSVTANSQPSRVFDELRAVLNDVEPAERQKLMAALKELEDASSHEHVELKLTNFMALAANSMTVIQPFIPALLRLLQ